MWKRVEKVQCFIVFQALISDSQSDIRPLMVGEGKGGESRSREYQYEFFI